MDRFYLQHHIQQGCGWVKIAEYACETFEQVESRKAEIRAAHPQDVVRFDVRPARPHLQEIAVGFAGVLRRWLTPAQFEEVCRRNVTIAEGFCASHDFCDANMAMDEALRGLGYAQLLDGDDWASNEDLAALWSKAWDLAKAVYLTKGVN